MTFRAAGQGQSMGTNQDLWQMTILPVLIYLTGSAIAILLFNASAGASWVAGIAIWAAASLLLGWWAGRYECALLAFLAIPFAVPFGAVDNYAYSEPLPIWFGVVILAPLSALLILVSTFLGQAVERRRQRQAGNTAGTEATPTWEASL